MTWYQLWKRLGKQPLYNTQNKNIKIEDSNGNLHNGKLEYYNNGSNFKLVVDDSDNQVEENKYKDESQKEFMDRMGIPTKGIYGI